MMISTKGRYALRFLIDVAEHQAQGYVPLRDTARRQDISEKYLEIIVKTLVQSGLLTALRGKGGGYRLNRPPERYGIREILAVTDGPLAPVACLEEGQSCVRRDSCPTRDLWQGLDRVISAYLDQYTLANLIGRDSTKSSHFIAPERTIPLDGGEKL